MCCILGIRCLCCAFLRIEQIYDTTTTYTTVIAPTSSRGPDILTRKNIEFMRCIYGILWHFLRTMTIMIRALSNESGYCLLFDCFLLLYRSYDF